VERNESNFQSTALAPKSNVKSESSQSSQRSQSHIVFGNYLGYLVLRFGYQTIELWMDLANIDFVLG
jgi:hypothetical protein